MIVCGLFLSNWKECIVKCVTEDYKHLNLGVDDSFGKT